MSFAHDLFSEINPAFCAYALVAFSKAYRLTSGKSPELPLVYLALPIALSGDLASAFEGTNKKTGLLEWLERNPQVQIDLTERVNASLGIVTEAVRFACFSHVLALDKGARLEVGKRKIKKNVTTSLSEGTAQSLKHAERLGYWFADAGSTKTVFAMVGITL